MKSIENMEEATGSGSWIRIVGRSRPAVEAVWLPLVEIRPAPSLRPMATPEPPARPRPERPPWWRQFLELSAVSGLAIAQPILDLFGRAPDAFIARDATSAEIVWFACLVALAPPLGLALIVLAVGRINARAGAWAHRVFLVVLAAAFGVIVLNRAGALPVAVVIAIGSIAAGGFVVAVTRLRWFADWVMFAAITPLIVGTLFLTSSSTAELIGAPEARAAEVEISEDAPSIVMLVFDEMPLISVLNREGMIDPELFPNLAVLAADGAWYRNTTTVATATQYAVPSILTGRLPDDARNIPVASKHPENLFTLLANRYDIEALESVTKLCPDSLCSGKFVDDPEAPQAAPEPIEPPARNALADLLGDARAAYRAMLDPDGDADPVADAERDLPPPTTSAPTTSSLPVTDAVDDAKNDPTTQGGLGGLVSLPELRLGDVETLLGSIETDEGPTLHYLHVQLPHQPYRLLPDGHAYAPAPAGFDPGLIREASGVRGPELAATDAERHRLILQVGAVDAIVGRVVARLKATGLYERSVMVVTSDHGVGMTPGGPIRALMTGEIPEDTYPDILAVPLIVKGPGIESGTVSDANVLTIDELPTIADLIDVELPWRVDGQSVLDPPRADATKQFRKVTVGLGGAGSLGPVIEYDGVELLAEVLRRHIDTLLRDDNARYRIFNADDAGELIGMPVDDVAREASTLTFAIDNVGAFDAVDVDTLVPAHVHGTPSTSDPVTIAFALNGIVAGVTTTFVEADQAKFDAVLIPDAFRDGNNELEVYVVGGTESARTLHPATLT